MSPDGHQRDPVAAEGNPGVMTFLIADVRGYSRYTEEYGDEAAASLSNSFVALVQEGVDAHGGTLVIGDGRSGGTRVSFTLPVHRA